METKVDKGKLTLEDGKRALSDHIVDKACEIQNKYGLEINYDVLTQLIKDPDFVKFPAVIKFDNTKVDPGLFAVTEEDPDSKERAYIIYIHDFFKDRPEDLPMLVLYHIVTINYGDFAIAEDAELFAASVLAMDKEAYYEKLCAIVDQIPDNQAPLSRAELEDQIMSGGGSCSTGGSCGCGN